MTRKLPCSQEDPLPRAGSSSPPRPTARFTSGTLPTFPASRAKLATDVRIDRLAVLDAKRLIVIHSEIAGAAAYSLNSLARVPDADAEAVFAPLAGNWPGYGGPTRPIALDLTGAYYVTAQDAGALEVLVSQPGPSPGRAFAAGFGGQRRRRHP